MNNTNNNNNNNTFPTKSNMLVLLLRLLVHLTMLISTATAQQQQDPTTLNGGSILAMTGKNCIAVAVDKRFGSGPQTINVSPRTMLIPHPRLIVGFTGLEGDVQSLASELSTLVTEKKERNLGFGFSSKSGNDVDGVVRVVSTHKFKTNNITPQSMSMLLSHVLYSRRRSPYYVEPIVAGLEKRLVKRIIVSSSSSSNIHSNSERINEEIEMKYNEREQMVKKDREECEYEYIPFLCAQDVIGAQSKSKSFVCSGAASKSLYGTAEAMWKPDLSPEDLVQVCGRAFISALERDCLSGYGAMIYLISGGEGITEIDLACRSD